MITVPGVLSRYPIALGTGDFFWDADIRRSDKEAVIRAAVEQGVQLVDTAAGYGDSELIVASALRGIRDRVQIATKVSPAELSYDQVIESCERSLQRLQTDYIDLLQIHWPNPSIELTETLDAMLELHRRELIQHSGMCNYTRFHLQIANEYMKGVPLAACQMEYNLHERSIEQNGVYDYCLENEILTLAYSPMDQGQLSSINASKFSLLKEIASIHSVSVPQIILAFLVRKTGITAIVRTTSLDHLRDNINAGTIRLSDEEVKAIKSAFPASYEYVPTDDITVALDGEWNHAVYQSLEQALENKLNFVPSPEELSKTIVNGEMLKPVRLKKNASDGRYDLVAGRIRYWAWVIAHLPGKALIPAYIRDNLEEG